LEEDFMTPKERELYILAEATWGRTAQMMMLFEEVGELLQAVGKWSRAKDATETIDAQRALVDEIVDVRIMLGQLEVMIGLTPALTRAQHEKKIKRLERRLFREDPS
jgi:NTP pyrophosphatase (non-canonical NTP hydrolase)